MRTQTIVKVLDTAVANLESTKTWQSWPEAIKPYTSPEDIASDADLAIYDKVNRISMKCQERWGDYWWLEV